MNGETRARDAACYQWVYVMYRNSVGGGGGGGGSNSVVVAVVVVFL